MTKRIAEIGNYDSLSEIAAYNEMVKRYKNITHDGFVERVINYSNVKGGKVLDIGTGPGQISIEIAKLNFFDEIIALDYSQKMLDFAKENAKKEAVSEKINFILTDAQNLPFPNNSFDTVICHNFIHEVANPLSVIKEIKRVVGGGSIFIRDLVRPPKIFIPLYQKIFTLFLNKSLKKQYKQSLQAALSYKEWGILFREAEIKNSVLRKHFITHMSIEKIAAPNSGSAYIKIPSSPFFNIAKKFYI